MYETAIEVLNKINSFGFKSYIVGGYPRDLYLNRESIDIDICTNATPKELKEIFDNCLLANQEYGGVTVVYKKIHFEITTFRKEIKYENNRFPVKIKYIDSLEEDMKRRDFTINTLCIDSDRNVIDLLNAKEDIDNKIIKTVGNSDVKIKTDILRSLRAVRFATILNFELDDSLKKSIIKHSKLLKKLSYNRKKEELDKIFSNKSSGYGIELIKELKIYNDLDLINFDKVVDTVAIGIWAQLDVLDIYPFSKQEKELITEIKDAMDKDVLNDNVLYKYGLYVCTIVGQIKGLEKCDIVKKYNELKIFSVKDIEITPQEICATLNRKPDHFIKEIYSDLEYKIINNEINNNKEDIIQYILR